MNMKMKMLTAAVTAALGAGSAQAVNVSQDGLGQVLLMPYYTVQSDNETLISVTNATGEVKAVKVRFREAQNSAEVLDFNLYLSPWDVWTGKVKDADDGIGAKLITYDNSCTVPKIPEGDVGVAFRNFVYAGAGPFRADKGDQGMGRTSEGYVEIIEMGVIDSTSAPARWATHNQKTGVPNNCAGLVGLWSKVPPGAWLENDQLHMLPGDGGLFGEANVINVQAGVEGSEPVTVLDNFNTIRPIHAEPGSGLPQLTNAQPNKSQVFIHSTAGADGVLIEDDWDAGIDAVSAVLMADSISNGYSVNPVVQSETEWVVTFPTKRFYTWPDNQPVIEPFTNNFEKHAELGAGGGGAFEPVTMAYWDREERVPTSIPSTVDPEGPDFSPSLPDIPPCVPGEDITCTDVWALPYEANVVSFDVVERDKETGEKTLIQESNVLSSEWASVGFSLTNLSDTGPFYTGWARMNFGPVTVAGTQVSSDRALVGSDHTYTGLPVIGFMATILRNKNVGDGAAYASTAEHRYNRDVETTSPVPTPR